MSEPNQPNRDERIDRYVRGELTAAEARALAQESLADPELFEELTYSAVAKQAVGAGFESGRVTRFPRPGRFMLLGSIAAAIVVLASVYAMRQGRKPAGVIGTAVHPTLELARAGQQPVLLANDLPTGSEAQPDAFRGAEPKPRVPKASGTIIAIEAGMAAIDLGSVDGLKEGLDLDVYTDDNPARPTGHLRVEAVFRERARGSIEGRIRPHDQVRIPPEVHLAAGMEQVRTLAAKGEPGAARTAAEEAVRWAASAGVPAEAQVPAWNTLAVLRLLQGDRAGGETLLKQALAACPHADLSYPQILNNLGVLAELNGDPAKAKAEYESAVRAHTGSSSGAQEKVIESNLVRIAR